MNEWTPPEDAHILVEERAPWIRWGLSLLALMVITAGAIWLIRQVIIPKNLPVAEPNSESVQTGTETTFATPPRSSDEEAWVRALEKDTLEGYREYLTLFPSGRYKTNAQDEIDRYDNQAWGTAKARNTLVGYEDYLEAWPEGLHASKAREKIAEIKKRAQAIADDADERAAQEQADWDQAARENTIESYGRYLTQHPSGEHAEQAEERLLRLKAEGADMAAWQQAQRSDTVTAYQQYLTSFPQGAYVAQAMAAIDALRPAPGRAFRDCDVCPLMVSLASGQAQLGAEKHDPDARPNEKPQRAVTFSNMFAMGVTEVTFSQWNACISDKGCPALSKRSVWGEGDRPVIYVSWDAAQSYVKWLSNKTGMSYSLPSEAQWEYAARAGDTGIWMGGSAKALCAFANGAAKESALAWANQDCMDPAADRTLPVGTLGANKMGLKDMIGNVAEWTLDCNTLNLNDAPANGDADMRGSCNQRIVRGGSWFSGPTDLRYTARLVQRRGDSNDFTGFRVVRKIEN